jgi:hypothetical protein
MSSITTTLASVVLSATLCANAFAGTPGASSGGATGAANAGTIGGGVGTRPARPGENPGSMCPAGTSHEALMIDCIGEFHICAGTARMNQLSYNPIARIWYSVFVDEMPKCNFEYAMCVKISASVCGVQNPNTTPPALPW